MVRDSKYNGRIDSVRKISRSDGVRGFYRGFGMSVLTYAPSNAVYIRMFNVLGTVYRRESFQALYKGWLPSIIGFVPYVSLNFAIYESLKDWLIKSRPFGLVEDSEFGIVTRLACGAAAGQLVKQLHTLLMSFAEECKWLYERMLLP